VIICDNRNELLLLVQRGQPCLEVGVFVGDFARQIDDVCRPSRLCLIDAYSGQVFSCDEHGGNPRTFHGDSLHAQMRSECGFYGWSLHRAGSQAIMPQLPANAFELVYIDADHSEAGCRADLEAGWRLLQSGGWLAGHDYSITPGRCVNPMHYAGFGVKAAVDAFCESHGVSITAMAMDGYTSFAIRKP
jgi:hypothetical protein